MAATVATTPDHTPRLPTQPPRPHPDLAAVEAAAAGPVATRQSPVGRVAVRQTFEPHVFTSEEIPNVDRSGRRSDWDLAHTSESFRRAKAADGIGLPRGQIAEGQRTENGLCP
jgi:hypothetical protein